jgi:hypothetical protein
MSSQPHPVSSIVTSPKAPVERLSVLQGPIDPPLVDLTLGELLELQTYNHGSRECLVIPWTGARWTYNDLSQQSYLLAQALLDMGVGTGDRVGIMAGNCEQYAAVFFAVSRIGAILVILNNTYTPAEGLYALSFAGMCPVFLMRCFHHFDQRAFGLAIGRMPFFGLFPNVQCLLPFIPDTPYPFFPSSSGPIHELNGA